MGPGRDHWHDHARQWSYVGPPLRPCQQDIKLAESWVRMAAASLRAPVALLLGVTPELAAMQWPAAARLLAADRNISMVKGVWPGGLSLPALAVVGDWLCFPLEDGSVDIVIGDGCYTPLRSPEGFHALNAEIHRVLRPRGHFIMRYFTRPQRADCVEDVFNAFYAGRIGNFHVLKWRLAMALHGSLEEGVRLGDIWEAWHSARPSAAVVARELGWSEPVVNTIENYRDLDTRYTFPLLDEVRDSLSGLFAERECYIPDYELGECCPSLLLSPIH